MNKKEELALFLGMLSGDGCLSIGHNGEGYRHYPIQFCNTEKDKVLLFDNLFFELFGIRGKISSRRRLNRKEIWHFLKYSVKIVNELKEMGFPEGLKRDILRIPQIVKSGTKREKLAFVHGVIITDGCIRKDGRITFHTGSKLFLEDISKLIEEFISCEKPVKEFIQKEKYRSYQLYLNKHEGDIILSTSPCATMVLGRS